jgi:hypothetical protein
MYGKTFQNGDSERSDGYKRRKKSFRDPNFESPVLQSPRVQNRVARFFLVQHTKTGENIPNVHKVYHLATKLTKCP